MTFLPKMTYYSLVKTLTISFFKAHISEELKKVRQGARVVICDRDIPIAEVVPYKADTEVTIVIHQPRRAPFEISASPIRIDHDPLEYLTEDRALR